LSSIVVFSLEEQKYGVPIEMVREIITYSEITPVPGTPPFFEGFMNVRGELVSVTNLRQLIGMETPDDQSRFKILILTSMEGASRGIMADDVTAIVDFSLEDLQPAENGKKGEGFPKEVLRGVADVEGDLVVVLDVDKLLAEERKEEEKLGVK
jgi:purine-binding chemotaxis protein CheW